MWSNPYTALTAPVMSFAIAFVATMTMPKFRVVSGFVTNWWFMIPGWYYARATYSVDQIQAYGLPPWDRFSACVLVCGAIGVLVSVGIQGVLSMTCDSESNAIGGQQ